MGKIFNIIGCSLALAGYGAASTVVQNYNRHVLRKLINALGPVPRPVKARNLRRYRGTVFVCDLDEDLPDDQNGATTIILLDDNEALPKPQVRDVDRLVNKGGPGVFHLDNKLLFATKDNSSPITNGRKYLAVHSWTRDPERYRRLAAMTRESQANDVSPALRALQAFAIVAPGHFAYESVTVEGEAATLGNLRCALDHRAELVFTAETLSVRPSTFAATEAAAPSGPIAWDIEIRGMAEPDAPDARWHFAATLDPRPGALAMPRLRFEGPGGLAVGYEVRRDRQVRIEAGRLRVLRALMMPWFTDPEGLGRWFERMLALVEMPLEAGGFALALDPPARAALHSLFSDAAVDATCLLEIDGRAVPRPARLVQPAAVPG